MVKWTFQVGMMLYMIAAMLLHDNVFLAYIFQCKLFSTNLYNSFSGFFFEITYSVTRCMT